IEIGYFFHFAVEELGARTEAMRKRLLGARAPGVDARFGAVTHAHEAQTVRLAVGAKLHASSREAGRGQVARLHREVASRELPRSARETPAQRLALPSVDSAGAPARDQVRLQSDFCVGADLARREHAQTVAVLS